MPSLTIKGIPDRLLRRLRKQALSHRRSLNSEVLTCLERAVELPSVDPIAWLKEADRLRSRLALRPLSDAALRRARSRGRP
ncbi:MAG: Arc family DNA-binding protein [Candidatus Eisenbacteria bacterium]|nr:Arc family DNA-binding protein [Candidatus Eisenbacteria bacterium]